MKAFTDMIRLVSNPIFTLLVVCSFFACKAKKERTESQGYLNSLAYKEYLKGDNNERTNAEYSIKRMFMLLNEESFLYSSDYDFYAVLMHIHKGYDTIHYYILKSKDSLTSVSFKKLNNANHFLFSDKVSGDTSDKITFKFEIISKLVNNNRLSTVGELFKNAEALITPEGKYFPQYGGSLRGLYLYHNNKYYWMNDYTLPPEELDKIEAFFREIVFSE